MHLLGLAPLGAKQTPGFVVVTAVSKEEEWTSSWASKPGQASPALISYPISQTRKRRLREIKWGETIVSKRGFTPGLSAPTAVCCHITCFSLELAMRQSYYRSYRKRFITENVRKTAFEQWLNHNEVSKPGSFGQGQSVDNEIWLSINSAVRPWKRESRWENTHRETPQKKANVYNPVLLASSVFSLNYPFPPVDFSRNGWFPSNAAYWKNPKDSSDKQISKCHYQFFSLRNASSIWFAPDKFSVSSIIIKHTQNRSVFPRIQLGWHWIGDSAWAAIGRVPLHLNYHVPSLCGDQAVPPPCPNTLWIAGHCPFTPCLSLSWFIGHLHWALKLAVLLPSPGQKNMPGNRNGAPLPAWLPATPRLVDSAHENETMVCSKTGEREQQWGVGDGGQERAEWVMRPSSQTWLHQCWLVWLWPVTSPSAPQVSVSSWVKWGTTAPTWKTVRISNKLYKTYGIK